MPPILVKHILPYYKINNLITEEAEESVILESMYDFLINIGVKKKKIDLYNVPNTFMKYTQDFITYKVVPTDLQLKIQKQDQEALDNIDMLKQELQELCNKWAVSYDEDFNLTFNSNVPEIIKQDMEDKAKDIYQAGIKNRMRISREKQNSMKKNGIPLKFLELYNETELNVESWIEFVRSQLNLNPFEIADYPYKDFIMKYNIIIKNQEAEERARKEAEKKANSQNPQNNFT